MTAGHTSDVKKAEPIHTSQVGKPEAQASDAPGTEWIIQLQRTVGNQAVMRMLADGTLKMKDRGIVQRAPNQSFMVLHDVPLIPQLSNMSCWAASAAMLVGWRDSLSIADFSIADQAGARQQYKDGLLPNDRSIFPVWGMVDLPPQSYAIETLKDMIEDYGPLWFAADVGAPHARVITGIYGDGTPTGMYFKINDPWPVGKGSQYELTVEKLTGQVESLAMQEMGIPDSYYFARLR